VKVKKVFMVEIDLIKDSSLEDEEEVDVILVIEDG